MYAVVKIGANQYKVTTGAKVEVDRLTGNIGDNVSFPALLVVDEKNVKMGKDASQVPVNAKIVEHKRGEKIDVMRYRNKSRYRRKRGFRQSLTLIEIQAIGDHQAPQLVESKVADTSVKNEVKAAPVKKTLVRKKPAKSPAAKTA